MNILRVIDSMDPKSGGPCQGIRNSINAMQSYEVRNEVVCLDDPKAEFIIEDHFKIHAVGPSKGPWHYSSKLMPWLKANIHRFDAVIIHGLWLYASYAAEKVLAMCNKPWFVMPHGMLDPYFQKAHHRKLKALRNEIYWRLIENKVINRATAVLYTTEEEMSLADQSFKSYNPNKAINVGYGIKKPPKLSDELGKAFLEYTGLDPEKEYILFLSRIHPKKGLDLLVKAYADIQPSDLDLVIAGPGENTDYGIGIKEFVKVNGLESRVHFTGMLTGDAKWAAIHKSSVFALISHQENFGIAVAEALACAKPVIISNKVNIWKEVASSNSGFVADDDINGAIDLLNKWLSTGTREKAEMSSKAQLLFHDKFDIDTVVKNLIDTIESELGK